MRYLLIIRDWKLTFFFNVQVQTTGHTKCEVWPWRPATHKWPHHVPRWTCSSHSSQPSLNVSHLEGFESHRVPHPTPDLMNKKSPGWTSGTWVFEKLLNNSDVPGPSTALENSVRTLSPNSPDCELLRAWRGPRLLCFNSPRTSPELTQARCSLNIYSNWITRKVEVVIASRLFSWILLKKKKQNKTLWYLLATFFYQFQGSLEERWLWRAGEGTVGMSCYCHFE